MRINLKNFGLLETLVSLSVIYVVGMLIWTASTRPAVEAKANLVKENHQKVVDFINEEINMYKNEIEDLMNDVIHKTMFTISSLKFPTLGTKKSLENITKKIDGNLKDTIEPHAKECIEFAEFVANDQPVTIPAEHSLQVMKILDGIYKSQEVGKEIILE